MHVGEIVPNYFLNATNNTRVQLNELMGRWIVVYFYPKDATPGCSIEARDFRDAHAEFTNLNATLFGVSRDSIQSHEKFKQNQSLPFELISDADELLCTAFDVIRMKSMFGKQVRGIERSTFIIDPTGKLCREWRKVKVIGHVEEVKSALSYMQLIL